MRAAGSDRPSSERYFIVAVIIAAIVVLGFTPNYVLRILRDTRYLTPIVHLHGLVMTAWIALFLVQTTFVAKHRVDLHRRLGMIGAWLIVPMLLLGMTVLLRAAARKAHGDDALFHRLLIAFDGVNLLLFACLAGGAVLMRRRSDWHKRLMLLATLSLLGPAFGRMTSYVNGFRADNDLVVLLAMLACAFLCVGIDIWQRRRWHPAFVWGGATLVAADLLTYTAKVLP
jgi:hypothetical protein